ncbi:MAG: thiamine pyrophosphate-binding protein [Chloroflexota bacterium]
MAQQPAEKSVQGGKHVAAVLKEEGVEYYFAIAGGHLNPLMVGLGMAGIKLVHMRHEQAAGYAADAYARSSGKVGICMGTAGPGMTNMVSALCQAQSAKSAVVAIMGQHSGAEDGRGALQEARADQILNSCTKWTRRVVSPTSLAYFTKKAIRDALTYPQGPVVLEIPADILRPRTTMSQQQGYVPNAYPKPAPPHGDPAAVEKAVKTLLAAQKPIIAGGEAIFWSHAEKELLDFVELTNIPVITRRTARGAVPEDHPLAFSARARGAILRSSDVAVIVGLSLGFLEGYGAWAKGRKLIQITESMAEVETTTVTDTIILGNPKAVLTQMIDCVKDITGGKKVPRKEAWLKEVDDLKAAEKKRMTDELEKVKNNVPMHPAWVAQQCVDVLDKDATVILDARTQSGFITERFVAKHSGAVLDAGLTAGVGHGIGMGVGAQLARPGKQVLVIMGDGGTGLGGGDVETAVRSQLPVVYQINNNSVWMTTRGPLYFAAIPVVGHQPDYSPWFMMPTRYDQMFAAVGAYTERVEDPSKVRAAMERAFQKAHSEKRPAVVDTVLDRTTGDVGTGRTTWEMHRKGDMAFMDPEDCSPEIRDLLFPELAKKK